MAPKYTVPLKTIAEEHKLTVVHAAADYDTALLDTADVNRPALQLTGFYSYFDPHRLQVLGRVEGTYLDSLTAAERRRAFEEFMKFDLAGIIFCHGVTPFPECMDMALKYDRTVFVTNEDTSVLMADILASLSAHLAPRLTTHGVLVEVYGEGVLITGDSGIGKSETALELIKRGHRLIADDAVEIKRVSHTRLIGSAPSIIQYYMELRGIGVINVRQTYGIGAVKPEADIDMVVHLEPWEEGKMYDRLGLDELTETMLGISRPKLLIPVRPGRNLAVIMELAAMNNRQKKLGYNAAEALAADIDRAIENGQF